MNNPTFADRAAAGRELGARLRELQLEGPIVAGISRGGMVVAEEVARALGAPLDVVAVRKCRGPDGVAIGAVAEHEVRVEGPALIATAGLTREQTRRVVADRLRELAQAVATYRRVHPPVAMTGQTVVLVDGGMTTAATATAAARAAFARGAERAILAVPVATTECVEAARRQVDDVVCLRMPPLLLSVSESYDCYPPVSDDDVVEILRRAREGVIDQPSTPGSTGPRRAS
jgi:putative phosphoribosyl transferase